MIGAGSYRNLHPTLYRLLVGNGLNVQRTAPA
jgi:hypothetical protein